MLILAGRSRLNGVDNVAARLTDEQKKRIIADYVESGSYRATARKNGVAMDTVRRIVASDSKIVQKASQKKAENTLDMLEYMDSRKGQAQGIIDTYLEALADPEKLENASLQQIATALGIVVDKFTKTTPAGENALSKLDEVLKEIGGVV